MKKKQFTDEQMVNPLKQLEAGVANGAGQLASFLAVVAEYQPWMGSNNIEVNCESILVGGIQDSCPTSRWSLLLKGRS